MRGMELLTSAHALAAEAHDPGQKLLYTGISVLLTAFAGIMSGLTLGLMSMDAVDLEVLIRSGTDTEKWHAQRIIPVVKRQHLLLVTLLLCNAAAMEALPLFIDKLTDPVTAIVLSVTVVLAFGEVLPQAVCSRYGLAVGSYSAWLVRILMIVCWPIAWPISKLLDYLLGADHSALFRKGQLKALVDIHSAQSGMGGYLTPDEVTVIRGALDLTAKKARQAMTPLDKVFMLAADTVLDGESLARILRMGHSRVPVHRPDNRTDLLGVVLVKELVLLDPDDRVRLDSMRIRPVPFLGTDTPMYDLLRLFQTGRSHMVFLRKPLPHEEAGQDNPSTDINVVSGTGANAHPGPAGTVAVTLESTLPASDDEEEEIIWSEYERHAQPGDIVGLITVEDIIEELIGTEIVDETDTHVDNERREPVNAKALAKRLPESLRQALKMERATSVRPRSNRQVQAVMSRGNSGMGLPDGTSHAAALAAKDSHMLRRASTGKEPVRGSRQLKRSYTDGSDQLQAPLLSDEEPDSNYANGDIGVDRPSTA